MATLIDLLSVLAVPWAGLSMVVLAFTVGGIVFLGALARPLTEILGATGRDIVRRTRQILVLSALGLLLAAGGQILLEMYRLATASGLPLADVWADLWAGSSVRAEGVLGSAAVMTAGIVGTRWDQRRPILLSLVACVILGAAALSVQGSWPGGTRWPLVALAFIHGAAVSVWLGGLPYYLGALALSKDHVASYRVSARFAAMASGAALATVISGVGLTYSHMESLVGLYQTPYGVMLLAKGLLFLVLVGLGCGAVQIIQRLRRSPDAPVLVLRRLTEAALGVGVTVFVASAWLSLLPIAPQFPFTPDLKSGGAAAWDHWVEQVTSTFPRLVAPDPTGETTSSDAASRAWSEVTHHWAGVLVMVMGLLALLERWRPLLLMRHWPLLFLGLAVLVGVRADPESWPLGTLGFWEAMRDPGVAWHRLLVIVLVGLGLIEWGGRIGLFASRAALAFPILVAAGGTLIFADPQAGGTPQRELLFEWTYSPIALLAIVGAWARWLELRLSSLVGRLAGWLWPVTFVLIGLILLMDREF